MRTPGEARTSNAHPQIRNGEGANQISNISAGNAESNRAASPCLHCFTHRIIGPVEFHEPKAVLHSHLADSPIPAHPTTLMSTCHHVTTHPACLQNSPHARPHRCRRRPQTRSGSGPQVWAVGLARYAHAGVTTCRTHNRDPARALLSSICQCRPSCLAPWCAQAGQLRGSPEPSALTASTTESCLSPRPHARSSCRTTVAHRVS